MPTASTPLVGALALLLFGAPISAAQAIAAPRDPDAERLVAALASLERDRGPEAVVALAELDEVIDAAPDRAQAAQALARLADDPGADPEVRDLARHRLAAQEVSRGNLQKAAAQRARLGFVERWLVVGPFDDEGKKGLDVAYPPEQEIDLRGRWRGKVRDISWRAVPTEAVVEGSVELGAVLRPASEVAAYALAVVDSPRPQAVRLMFGGSGRAKVWVNGALALTDRGDHPARLDQHGVLVTLRAGPNRVMVKLCQVRGAMSFMLRLGGEAGGSLGQGLVAREPNKLLSVGLAPALGPATGAPPRPLAGLVERLEARAEASSRRPGAAGRSAEAAARRALAVALQLRQSFDAQEHRAAREARRAVELAPDSVVLRLLAASLEEERNRRLEQLTAAQATDPDEPRVLLALAEEQLALERPQEAVALLERVTALAPGWVRARVELASALDRAGLSARSVAARLALADVTPPTLPAVTAAATAARRLGRLDRAAGLLRTALALKLDDDVARGSLTQLLLARGDLDGALALHAEALRLDPSDVPLRLRLADLLAANGRLEEAEGAWAAALSICPEEAQGWEQRGRARLRAGRQAEALADLVRALELRPQDPAVKELVRSLEPARERYETPYLLDAAALAAAPDGAASDDDTVVLGEVEVVRLHPSGLASRYQQQVIKVRTQRGADAARQQAVSFDPGRQEVKVERGRIFKADGTVVEAWDEGERSASEPWYRLYYDTRVKTLTFPALAPGDVLEVAWRLDDTAAENLLSDYFGDLTFVDGGAPKRRLDYVLLAPAGRRIHASAPAGVVRTERELPGGLTEHRWAARDVARLDAEPRMPGWAEVARVLHVSTYASWDEVNRFYWGLVRDQLKPTPELVATARRLAAEALSARGGDPRLADRGLAAADREAQRAVVAALYGFVVTQTRYVGLEFGIHGFKPYRVDQVLTRRFGDCKDKASLTHALLEAVGLESRLVLLRMRRLGRLPAEPASLAIFNHAILYVPTLDLWLDGTASYTGTRELPGEDRGATVLVVAPEGPPRFTRTPEAEPGQNRVESRFAIALQADGSASVTGHSLLAGAHAPGYRRAYQAEQERRSALEQAFARTFPGLHVERVAFSDLSRLEEDVTLDFALAVPRWAELDGPGLRFTPFGGGAGYTETWASLAARRHPLLLGEPTTNRFAYRITPPPGWEVRGLPEPASGDGPQAAFEVRWRTDGDAVVAEGSVTFKQSEVSPTDYPAFRELMTRIDRAFGRRVTAAPRAAMEAR
jgi:tetratricopeptide (TPR) repeat protein/transglutaminase-like putative cysteine protease